MKKNIFLISFLISGWLLNAQTINYNQLSSECQSIAEQGLKKISQASRQWFIENSAKHPAGNFDTVWVKKTLSGKFTTDQINQLGDIFLVMMAYQKMMNKEAREDKKITQEQAKIEKQANAEKLNQSNQSITRQQQEARDKYNQSMQAANTELLVGVISAAADSSHSQNNNGNMVNSNVAGKLTIDSLKNKLNNKPNTQFENSVTGQKLRNQLLKLNL